MIAEKFNIHPAMSTKNSQQNFDIRSVRVRLATTEDYEAIMDINRNVYGGVDYLPALYFTFQHNPEIYSFVAEIGEVGVSLFIFNPVKC